MHEGPLTARTRRLIDEFSRLLAERARRHAEISKALETGKATALADHARALQAAAQGFDEACQDARAWHDAQMSGPIARLEDSLAAARKGRAAEVNALQEAAASDDAVIKKWLTDKVWMADSVFETSSPRPGVQFEEIRKELAAAGERLRLTEQSANAYLRACRFGALPFVAPPGDASKWGEGDASKRLTEFAQATELASKRLGGMLLPRFFIALWPVVHVLLAAGLGAGFVAWRQGIKDALPVVIGAGVGAVAGVLLLVAIRFLAKQQVAGAKVELATALAGARAAGERWLEIASDNRRRTELHIKETHEIDVKGAHTKAAAKRDELAKSRKEQLASIEAKTADAIANLARERAQAASEADTQLARRLADASGARDAAIVVADRARDESLAHVETTHQRDTLALAETYRAGMAAAHADAHAGLHSVSALCPDWSQDRWTLEDREGGWAPPDSVPHAVSIGRITLDLAALPGGLSAEPHLAVPGPPRVELPIPMEIPDRCSLLLRTGAQGRADAISLLQATMLRLLTTFPPGKVRFTIIDPVGLGQNFAAFMHLADYEAALVSDRIWTEPRHIEQRLTDLTEHMENVIQKYLRNQFRTIEEYNVHAGEVAEPYRFLVIADLPSGFNELAAKRLASILDSGPRCGVYTLIAADTRQALPQGLTKSDLNKVAVQLTWRAAAGSSDVPGKSGAPPTSTAAGAFTVEDPVFGKLPLAVDKPPADELFNRLVHMAGRHAKDSSRVQVPFEMIAPPMSEGEAGLWKLSSAKEIVVPMGRAGATKLQHMTLGKGTAQHALIAGRTGSGKSTLLHAMITSLATWYGPDEVELYLVDFKKGVEFKTYASHEIPHARVIAIESEREFGLSVLRKLDAELKRRGELYRQAEVQDIAGFRSKVPTVRMPRVLLIVDEFQELFVEDDKLAQEASLLLDRLVRQGRAFGMHAVLGSQTLGGAYSLARSTIGQMAVRIALQCSEADSYLILSDDNPAARLLSRPGEAIYNDASGALEGNSPFQVAWLPEDKRDLFLGMVQSRHHAAINSGKAPRLEAPIIFEGSAPARVERNGLLDDLLSGRATPKGAPLAWLGEPIAIKEPTAAIFRRQSAANLLVVGQKDESALAMFATGMISLAQTTRGAGAGEPAATNLYILDGTPADAPTAGYLERVASSIGSVASPVAYRDVEKTMSSLVAELDRRAAADSTDAPPVFVCIYALQRFRMLRRPENEFDFGSTDGSGAVSADKQFLRLLREGPALGIHTLIWSDTVSSFNRTLERSALREFDQRILFQMSAADSSSLIDVASAGLIGANRALFYSEEQGTVEKFRPYALPGDDWLASAAKRSAPHD